MDRREFLRKSGRTSLGMGAAALGLGGGTPIHARHVAALEAVRTKRSADLTLFLAGDVMTGRGIDQILPHSVDPTLHEPYVRDARRYVELAQEESGSLPSGVSHDYIWGDALPELERVAPVVRIINLETAVTLNDQPWPGKGIQYRMHPANLPVLTAAGIDVCVLGNNHVLDWGYAGLEETLSTLRGAGLKTPGAGDDLENAAAPAVIDTGAGRLLVFSLGAADAGVPRDWAAGSDRPGVNWTEGFSAELAAEVAEHIGRYREPADRVIMSLHWGSNWGYQVPSGHRAFAHGLIDRGAVDLIHGHSSHHPRPIEVHGKRLILYGCGDFINDYEGIGGREEYRGELSAMFFPRLSPEGELLELTLTPMRIHRMRLQWANESEARWLAQRLDRESREFGSRVVLEDDDRLLLQWD